MGMGGGVSCDEHNTKAVSTQPRKIAINARIAKIARIEEVVCIGA